MTAVDQYVTNQYKRVATEYFQLFYLGEQWAGDVAGYWMNQVPFDQELADLKFELGKMAYDECRHVNIIRDLIERYGGQEAVDEIHEIMKDDAATILQTQWLYRMNQVYIRGPDDFVEFLTTLPLLQEANGIKYFSDIAQCTDDPVLADAAESIVQDELMHGSIGAEFIPVVIDKYGDHARESLQRGIDRWTPLLFSSQGTPEANQRQNLIDAGFASLTVADIHEHLYNHLTDALDSYHVSVPDYEDIEFVPYNEVLEYSEAILKDKGVYNEVTQPRHWESKEQPSQ